MTKNKLIAFDDEIVKKGEDEGINFTALSNKLLKEHFEKKANLPEETLKAECSSCHAIVDRGYLCRVGRWVYCEACENKEYEKPLLSDRTNKNFKRCQFHYSTEKEHMHEHFGVWKKSQEILKTLKEIEMNKIPGKVPVKVVEPQISAPF